MPVYAGTRRAGVLGIVVMFLILDGWCWRPADIALHRQHWQLLGTASRSRYLRCVRRDGAIAVSGSSGCM